MATSLGNPVDMTEYIKNVTGRSQEYWNRDTDTYNWGKDKANQLEKTGGDITQQALDTSRAFGDYSKRDREQYDQTVAPGMREQMQFARDYTTPGRMAANRGSAMAGVNLTFDAAGDMAKRQLMSYGVDPSAGRFAGLDAGIAAKRAAAAASAGTTSDRDTEARGQEYLDRAIQRGQVLPGQAANEAGVSMAAGNQAVNTGLATAQGQRVLKEPTGYAPLATELTKEWKNAMLDSTKLGMQQNQQAFENQLAQSKQDASGSSGIGSAIGAGLGILGMAASFIPGGQIIGPMMSMAGGMAGGSKGFAEGGLVKQTETTTIDETSPFKRYAEGGEVEDIEAEFVDDQPTADMDFSEVEDLDSMSSDPMQDQMPGQMPGVVPPEASPSGGEETDDVHAMLNEGEFVIPKDVVKWHGEKFFQKLIEKAHAEMAGPQEAEPEEAPVTAMALSPPTYQSGRA